MSDKDDLSLKVGFVPNEESLKRSAKVSAKIYSSELINAIKKDNIFSGANVLPGIIGGKAGNASFNITRLLTNNTKAIEKLTAALVTKSLGTGVNPIYQRLLQDQMYFFRLNALRPTKFPFGRKQGLGFGIPSTASSSVNQAYSLPGGNGYMYGNPVVYPYHYSRRAYSRYSVPQLPAPVSPLLLDNNGLPTVDSLLGEGLYPGEKGYVNFVTSSIKRKPIVRKKGQKLLEDLKGILLFLEDHRGTLSGSGAGPSYTGDVYSKLLERRLATSLLEDPATLYNRHLTDELTSSFSSYNDVKYAVKDLQSLGILGKGFRNSKSWNAYKYIKAFTLNDSGGYEADIINRLRALQFIKNSDYAYNLEQQRKYFNIGLNPLGYTDTVMQGIMQDAVRTGATPENTDKLLYTASLRNLLRQGYSVPTERDLKYLMKQSGIDPNSYRGGKLLYDTEWLTSRSYARFYTTNEGTPNMDELRQAAVERGQARWIDPTGPKDWTNWERVSKKSTAATDKWRMAADKLYAVLKSIKKVVNTVRAIDRASGQTVTETAVNLPNERAFTYGFTAAEAYRNKAVSNAIGLGPNAINSDVINFIKNRGTMKSIGSGFNLLSSALGGTFDTQMQGEDGEEAWWNTINAITESVRNKTWLGKESWLDVANNTVGQSGASLIGFLLNHGLSAGSLRNMQGLASSESLLMSELLNKELTEVRARYKQNYIELANVWMSDFGIPFRNYWDQLLDKLTPPLTKILHETSSGVSNITSAVANTILEGEINHAVYDNPGNKYRDITKEMKGFKNKYKGAGSVYGKLARDLRDELNNAFTDNKYRVIVNDLLDELNNDKIEIYDQLAGYLISEFTSGNPNKDTISDILDNYIKLKILHSGQLTPAEKDATMKNGNDRVDVYIEVRNTSDTNVKAKADVKTKGNNSKHTYLYSNSQPTFG